jgi:hypothetical protein
VAGSWPLLPLLSPWLGAQLAAVPLPSPAAVAKEKGITNACCKEMLVQQLLKNVEKMMIQD